MVAREKLEFDILANTDRARRNLDDFAGSVDDTGKSFDELGGKSSQLDKQITDLETSIKDLIVEFDKTGDVELLKSVKRDRAAPAALTSIRKELELLHSAAVEAADAVGDVGAAVVGVGGLNKEVLKTAGPGGVGALFSRAIATPLAPAIVGAIVAASPVIGASFNAALLAGVGAGGLGAGIASAIRQDQTVRTEFTRLGHEFVDVFDDMGERFVQPMRGAARFFRTELAASRDDWVEAISGLDNLVESGARGLAGFFEGMSPGAMKGLEVAERVLDKFFEKLPGLGEDVSTMFESFSQGGDGAVEAMEMLMDTIGNVAVATGEVVEFLSKVFDLATDFADKMGAAGADVTGIWGAILAEANSTTPKIKAAGDGFDDLGDSIEDTEVDVRGLITAVDDLLGRFLTLDELELRVAEGFADVREVLKDNGGTLDINTAKGRENLDAILDQVEALKDQRQANIDSGISVARANDIYNAQMAALRKLAQSLGVSRGELERWLSKYNLIQSKTVTLGINIKYHTSGPPPPAAARGTIIAAQHGGPVGGGTPPGVDAQLRLLASDEFVVRGPAARAIGPAGMAAINNADRGGMVGGVGSGASVDAIAAALARVLNGATLQINDLNGRTAQLLVRGG